MISFRQKGDFSNTTKFLEKAKNVFRNNKFDQYGQQGVAALASATPKDSGETANSWYYTIKKTVSGITISFNNKHIEQGVPIAIILQYGHGTGTGGWVEGRDYINPAIRPIFDKIADEAWKEVTRI